MPGPDSGSPPRPRDELSAVVGCWMCSGWTDGWTDGSWTVEAREVGAWWVPGTSPAPSAGKWGARILVTCGWLSPRGGGVKGCHCCPQLPSTPSWEQPGEPGGAGGQGAHSTLGNERAVSPPSTQLPGICWEFLGPQWLLPGGAPGPPRPCQEPHPSPACPLYFPKLPALLSRAASGHSSIQSDLESKHRAALT